MRILAKRGISLSKCLVWGPVRKLPVKWCSDNDAFRRASSFRATYHMLISRFGVGWVGGILVETAGVRKLPGRSRCLGGPKRYWWASPHCGRTPSPMQRGMADDTVWLHCHPPCCPGRSPAGLLCYYPPPRFPAQAPARTATATSTQSGLRRAPSSNGLTNLKVLSMFCTSASLQTRCVNQSSTDANHMSIAAIAFQGCRLQSKVTDAARVV